MAYAKIFSATHPPKYALSSLEDAGTASKRHGHTIVPEEIRPA